jgi:hypothetical protein
MKKKNIGSAFDGWLREEGIYEEVTRPPSSASSPDRWRRP